MGQEPLPGGLKEARGGVGFSYGLSGLPSWGPSGSRFRALGVRVFRGAFLWSARRQKKAPPVLGWPGGCLVGGALLACPRPRGLASLVGVLATLRCAGDQPSDRGCWVLLAVALCGSSAVA